ncbi:MAG TPA: M48 family metalloprotease [Candidatus Acidoferrales bacterium]|nr:M48 family metalloprotease [Candidatus Acidoferrales bacterium]
MKLRGYLTGRADAGAVLILDDRIELTSASRVVSEDGAGEHPFHAEELSPGMLVEAEGQWLDKHKFFAEKLTVDLREDEKKIHGSAYLQEEPADAAKIAAGEASELKLDGYWLNLDVHTKRAWDAQKAAQSQGAEAPKNPALAGYQVRYSGTRRKDGRIDADEVNLGPPAPADDYKMPHNLEVVPGRDAQTGIDVLEFRQGNKVHGRMKLLAERSVQEYVSHLGDSLIPEGANGTRRPIEFRFFVVEDPEINAASLPDGTLLINTGLLGALENEAQLAFVLSHEMAHVLQVHYRREIEETRASRVALTIAGVAAGAFIGNAGIFMAQLGIASVVNGHQRELENQADRLGLQNVIEHGYDPREAPNLSRIMINRYGNRTTSKLWSNHDSSVLRGSFLTVQLMREYPEGQWDGTKRNTPAFQTMKDDLGPVKIM